MDPDTQSGQNRLRARRIYYVHPAPLPSPVPSAIQVMRMCEGFTQAGCRPLLLARQPGRGLIASDGTTSLFEYYGICEPFPVRLLPIPYWRRFGVGLGVVSSIWFAVVAVRAAKKMEPDFVYTRDIYTAWVASRKGLPILFEEHGPPKRRIHAWMRRRVFRSRSTLGIVFISKALEEHYRTTGLLSDTNVRTVVAYDAARISEIRPVRGPAEGGDHKFVIGYVGSVLPGRGVELIISVARRLPQHVFRIIGGSLEQVQRLSEPIPSNVECSGFIEPGNVSASYDEIDVLLMPYQTNTMTHGGDVSTKWMSPLKMFEYMASGVPLIASDIPVLREVLEPDHNCLMVSPMDVRAWTQAIQRLVSNPELRASLAENAVSDVREKYNWRVRAQIVLGSAATGRSEEH